MKRATIIVSDADVRVDLESIRRAGHDVVIVPTKPRPIPGPMSPAKALADHVVVTKPRNLGPSMLTPQRAVPRGRSMLALAQILSLLPPLPERPAPFVPAPRFKPGDKVRIDDQVHTIQSASPDPVCADFAARERTIATARGHIVVKTPPPITAAAGPGDNTTTVSTRWTTPTRTRHEIEESRRALRRFQQPPTPAEVKAEAKRARKAAAWAKSRGVT